MLIVLVAIPPVIVAATIAITAWRIGPPPLAAADAVSVTVLDRQDRLLRAFTTPEGRWRLPVEPAEVDPRYLAMLIALEDQRFHAHLGVDPLALARAAWQFANSGRIVSGASTLTMQVARLLDGVHDRTLNGKLRQVARAIQLEQQLTKSEILRLYLRLAPFGGNLEGVRAASLAYFGKEPRRLSTGEAALLVALPQSPENRRPDRNVGALRVARNRVITRATGTGVLTAGEAERALREPLPHRRHEFPKLAPHLAEREMAADGALPVHRLTLDRDLQSQLENLARDAARRSGPKLSVGILAVDHASGEVLAHVGSADYLDGDRLGAIDMVHAVRSPGSTLKPVIYALAFEGALAHPETLIEDRAARFGTYVPRNFDEDYRGTVTIREALGHSLNVPAVKALNAVGPARLTGRLRRIGVDPVLPAGTEPTLAIALGGVGLTLHDLTQLYATLARGGEPLSLTHHRRDTRAASTAPIGRRAAQRRLVSPVAAWYVTDILKDAPPPVATRAGRIAYKTGTSYGYRDAWAIGYDGRHTVAVWVGRADGASTLGLTGRGTAAPVLFDAFSRIGEQRAVLPAAPAGAILRAGAGLPPPLRRFSESDDAADPGPFLEPPVEIAFPLDRSELEMDAGADEILLKANGGSLPLTWLVNGAPIASDPHKREAAWQPQGQGFTRLTVIDSRGRADRVSVRVR